jgi:exopolyphosphatase/guanosine-5'-triphosphate,3'-diphosphate pyrophosphatase
VRLATIDLGSNTVRFLAIDSRGDAPWAVIDQDQEVTRLGEGLATAGALGERPMARTRAVVERYVARGVQAGARDIRIVATSAVREAANGAAFATSITQATGCRVDVISGEEEARLTLRGILAGFGPVTGTIVGLDVGGGSTEYVLAVDGALVAAVSLPLGVVSLAERFPFPGRVDEARFEAMHGQVRERLEAELPGQIRTARPTRLIGTAGTATTLAALDLALPRYDAARVQGHVLRRSALDACRQCLARLTLAERAALPCLEPGRADLIVPGLAIVMATMECLAMEAMQVSDWGIREGIIAEMLEGAS